MPGMPRLTLPLLLAACLAGCASAPVAPSLKLFSDSTLAPSAAQGMGKVVFVHSYPQWLAGTGEPPVNAVRDLNMKRASGEGELNLFADGKPIGRLRAFEYVQVELPYGEHEIRMARPLVVADWKSSARLKVDQPLTHVLVEVGWTSGSLSVKSEPIPNVERWHRLYGVRR